MTSLLHLFVFGGKGTNGTPFSANDMTHVSSLNWNGFPKGVVSQQSDSNHYLEHENPLPSAGYFSSINKIHMVIFLWIIRPKQSRYSFCWGFPVTEFSKRSSLEIANSLATPLNEQKPFQKFFAISGSVRVLVTSLLQQFQLRRLLSEHGKY